MFSGYICSAAPKTQEEKVEGMKEPEDKESCCSEMVTFFYSKQPLHLNTFYPHSSPSHSPYPPNFKFFLVKQELSTTTKSPKSGKQNTLQRERITTKPTKL